MRRPEQIVSVEQTTSYNCGPCNAQMILRAFGEFRSQDDLEAQLGTTKQGTSKDAIRRFFWYKGFATEERACVGWHELKKLRQETENPLMVCWMPDATDSHYSLLKDVKRASVVLTDTTTGGDLEIDRETWMKAWKDDGDVSKQNTDVHWLMEVKKYG